MSASAHVIYLAILSGDFDDAKTVTIEYRKKSGRYKSGRHQHKLTRGDIKEIRSAMYANYQRACMDEGVDE